MTGKEAQGFPPTILGEINVREKERHQPQPQGEVTSSNMKVISKVQGKNSSGGRREKKKRIAGDGSLSN